MGLERLLEETPEAYYWMGFLMADGFFRYYPETSQYGLMFSITDKYSILKFSKFINKKYFTYNKDICKNGKIYTISINDKIATFKIMKKFYKIVEESPDDLSQG